MTNETSSFGRRQDSAAARATSSSPKPAGGNEHISLEHVAIGNLISVGIAALLLAIFAVGAVLSGAAKPAHEWSEAIGVAIFAMSALIASYGTAGRAGRAYLLHGLLSSLLIIAFTAFGILPWKGFIRLLIDVLEIAATVGAAIAGGVLARAQSRAGIDLPWRLLGRGFLAVMVGFLMTVVSLIVSARLGATASVTLPAFSLVVGIFAAWAIAPPGGRRITASIYFGLIIAAVTVNMVSAELSHSVKPHHWIQFLTIGVAWFFTRKIWRDPEFT